MEQSSKGSVSRRSAAVLSNFAWLLLAETKIKTNWMCSHVIFIIYFKFWIENTGGDGFNQFFHGYPMDWCIICLYSLLKSDHTYLQKMVAVHWDSGHLSPFSIIPWTVNFFLTRLVLLGLTL